MNYAPIVVFAYNRPIHLEKVLTALSENTLADQSTLYIFQDGYNTQYPSQNWLDIELVVKKKQWCKEVIFYKGETNKGCDQSEIDGVTKIINKHGKVIVLEDDLITSSQFLLYMNYCLNKFEINEKVGSINAFSFKIDNLPTYFFARGGNPLGWGTWKDRWALFNPDGIYLRNELKKRKLEKAFNYGHSLQLLEENKYWDVKWSASLLINNRLGLFSKISYTNHIGFDNSGTHNSPNNADNLQYKIEDLKFQFNPKEVDIIEIKEVKSTIRIYQHFYYKLCNMPYTNYEHFIFFYYRIKHKIKQLVYKNVV